MEINFYIWLILTIIVTAYISIFITRRAKKKDAKEAKEAVLTATSEDRE